MAPFNHVLLLLLLLFHFCYTDENNVVWYRTAKDNGDRLTQQNNLSFSNDKYNDSYTILVNRSMTYQSILGFGGAFTESSSHVFSRLNSTLQTKLLNMYYSPEDGIRYNMGRLPIGSCDFSLKHYTYDETPDDVDLTHFSIDHDRQEIIPFIKRAIDTIGNSSALYIVASPWSAPAWMKVEHSSYCPTSCLECKVKDKYQDTWANYLVQFLAEYKYNEGIDIWGITVQNEPGACPVEYEGMHYTPETQRDFIKNYLGPKLNNTGVKLLVYDHNKNHIVKWAKTIYSDSEASDYVWGTAVHWYSGDDFNNLATAHELYPNKPILATEATVEREKDPSSPKWEHGEHYAHDIIGDMNNWVVGFIDWNLLLDILGGPDHAGPRECEGIIKCGSDAMILADIEKQILYPQIFYYYVGHFSKYILRDSLRIYSKLINNSGEQEGLECIAFLTPQKTVVLIVMNINDISISFQLNDFTDNDIKRTLHVVALPHSIQTFIYS